MVRKDGVYIMESSEILGDVTIGENSSIWSKVVIRGDESPIRIGMNTNIQDMSVIHAEPGISMEIGDNVTIGHSAVIHCRRISSNCMIGMGAMLLNNVEVGEWSIIAAGTVVTEDTRIPPQSLVMGVPGHIVRGINSKDRERIEHAAHDYQSLSKSHYKGKYQQNPLQPHQPRKG